MAAYLDQLGLKSKSLIWLSLDNRCYKINQKKVTIYVCYYNIAGSISLNRTVKRADAHHTNVSDTSLDTSDFTSNPYTSYHATRHSRNKSVEPRYKTVDNKYNRSRFHIRLKPRDKGEF